MDEVTMHNVAFNYRQVRGAASDRLRTHPYCWWLDSATFRAAESGPRPTGRRLEMVSGIQGLRRLEVRDEHGVQCGLLIGFTERHQLVIGVAPSVGAAPMAVVDHDQSGEVFKLMRGALRGELS
jgi:hypothetical protein